jgi:hypothetical protein
MTVSQGTHAQRTKPRDPTRSVLMPPFPPEDALPHVEDAAVFQVLASIKSQPLTAYG